MHLGNFDLVGHALLFRGPGLTVPVERMEPERLFRFLVDVRRSKGINVVPFDRAGREMLAALRAGKIVGIIGDRNVGGSRGVRAEFFGKEAVFPRAPVSLARHAGSPVLVGVAVRLPSERFRGYITPVSMQRSGQAEADERENVRHIARVMEDFIRRFPDQWLRIRLLP
jgi:lauroyl/myristoyl acyltransferase